VDYVPDTSVIVDGRFNRFIEDQEGSRVILPEALISEVEHQANEGKSIGFAALEELKKLRQMELEGKIVLDITGPRPQEWQIRKAKSGEIDDIIRNVAISNDAVLVTGDQIQRDIAIVKGARVHYIEPSSKVSKRIEDFFDPETSSVHLKPNLPPALKKGQPGQVKLIRRGDPVRAETLEEIANNIVRRGRDDPNSFIEIDTRGATVVQLGSIRIVITRPPFSDDLEITAVRPLVKLSLDDYGLPANLIERLKDRANGILVAGAPGAGKSTFVQALAEFFNGQGKVVKTMERPRDLQVSKEITQYTGLEGSMEKTGDILLMVREDYAVFDEMRITNDFKVYADLRLAGVGMIGVVHATRPIDAIQRFINRIELGMIPQVIDTVIFIDRGTVASVLVTKYSVKVPSGMSEDDLARPVIEVEDFYSGESLYEIYTFGEQIVVVPVARQKKRSGLYRMAEERIENDLRKLFGTNASVRMETDNRVVVRVPEDVMPRVIGKKGANVNELEKKYGVHIDVEPLQAVIEGQRQTAQIEVKNRIIYLYVGEPNRNVKFYVDNILVLQAKSSNKGVVRIKVASDTGSAIYSYIKAGKKIEYSFF